MSQPTFVKESLPYGFIVYRTDDAETKRKVEADRKAPVAPPRLSLKLEVR